jgi:hypothetical protein
MEAAVTSAGIRLLGLPAEKSAKKQLTGSADEVVKTIASVLDQMITAAIDKRTADEFQAVKAEVFPKYVQLIVSLAAIVSAIVPMQVLSRLATDSFSELEADIREHALAAFGADMRDRAMFTVWTLRKIADLLAVIAASGKIANEDGDKDKEFFAAFLVHALSARFCIDCLRASMRSGHTIYPEVLTVVDDGLMSVVDAYAWIRQAADLHSPSNEDPCVPVTWDNEDAQLLSESMFDLSHEQTV